MSNKVKSVIVFLDNYEWIDSASILIMAIVSISLFINHSTSSFELMIIVGLLAILKGFLNFNIFLSLDLSGKRKSPKSFILVALINIVIGLILILNLITSETLLLVLTAMWMIIDSIPYMIYIIKNKLGKRHKYNPFFIFYGFILVVAICHIATLRTDIYGPAITLASFLALSCINLFLLKKESRLV
ncbi:hypothetical protein [Vagococcus fluvialis]|uniref:hypothetical protein n=1 Tax=Vagococcus fluvialis TaxID=2738 RepID=UPI001A8E918F|nr:hypothetical protein [Vagococcus fluvialis]MBO0437339.1 hypothetical protein [Vagococcus fluvialis]